MCLDPPVGERKRAQALSVGLAVFLGVFAWLLRDRTTLAAIFAFGAVAMSALAATLPWLRKLLLTFRNVGTIEVDMQEGLASAQVADVETSPEVVEVEIGSQDPAPPTPSAQDAKVVGYLNYAAGSLAVASILDWVRNHPSLVNTNMRLYLYDKVEDRLVSITDAGASKWVPGRGVVGTAYASGEYVLASGPAASDETHGLTPDEQRRHHHLAAVAAMPIFNDAGEVIGVVSASTEDSQHPLSQGEGEAMMIRAALLLSRIIVELLQWFDE